MIRLKRIKATDDLSQIKKSKYIIICIGTPIDNKLSPEIKNFLIFLKF